MADMMELGKLPKILKQLGVDDQRAAEIEKQASDAKAFVGQVAVKNGVISQDHLDQGLNAQAGGKITAATKDIGGIQAGTALDAPKWLGANWGNNGVNPPDKLSASSGVSGVANMMQNMTMVLKGHPEAAKDPKVAAAVAGAQGLVAQLVPGPDGRTTPLADAQGAIKAVGDGLKHAVEATGTQPKDRGGKDVSVDDYIAARSQEASQGVAQAQAREAAVGSVSGGQSVEQPGSATPHRGETSPDKTPVR